MRPKIENLFILYTKDTHNTTKDTHNTQKTIAMDTEITLMLPYVFNNISVPFITTIVNDLGLGVVHSIDMREVGDHKQAYVHVEHIVKDHEAIQALTSGKTIQITYDDYGHYWNIVRYVKRNPSPKLKPGSTGLKMLEEREAREADALDAVDILEEFYKEQAYLDTIVAEFKPPTRDEFIASLLSINQPPEGSRGLSFEEKQAFAKQFAALLSSM